MAAYCFVYMRDIMGKSEPKEVLRYVSGEYTILLYRRVVTYELVVKSYVDCSITYCAPDIPVWNPRLAMFLVSELGILNTAALMDFSKAFEAKKFSIFRRS
jgi:hypothetical protein